MKELIGHRCACVFSLPANQWPIEGYPAWVVIQDVDMPMVKMRSAHRQPDDPGMWVNASTIQTIRSVA